MSLKNILLYIPNYRGGNPYIPGIYFDCSITSNFFFHEKSTKSIRNLREFSDKTQNEFDRLLNEIDGFFYKLALSRRKGIPIGIEPAFST